MGLFQRRRHRDPEELERLQQDLTAFRERLDAVDAAKDELGDRVRRINDRLSVPLTSPPPTPPTAPAPPAPLPRVDPAETEQLRAEIARLDAHLAGIDGRMAALDERLTIVSTELANQLSELGVEIEALAARPGDGEIGEATLEALRTAQTRLANEQARYQIAFREDLAELADRLRRPG